MVCKICGKTTGHYFSATVLKKYPVQYYKCPACTFIQTEDPYWLPEAYNTAITTLDIGLLSRNNHFMPAVKAVIERFFDPAGDFVDFGGGYGVFVRLMRDQGYRFFRQDLYCDNLFAKSFDITDWPEKKRFELLTSFEVFEHLANPVEAIEEMLTYSDSILFSTELQPNDGALPENWYYFAPEMGQHVSIYSQASLKALAQRLDLQLYSDGSGLHLLTPRKFSGQQFKFFVKPRVAALYHHWKHRTSLLTADYNLLLRRITGKEEVT